MNDTITVCGIIATEPRHLVTDTGIAITSMRLASPSRRWDRATSTWTNGATNWYTVTAFRSLAANVHRSLKKGDRILVTGRIRIRTWERDGRGGTSVEIDAEGLGHDLAWGISNWVRVPRHAGESTAAPGSAAAHFPNVDPVTGEVGVVGDEGTRSAPEPDAGVETHHDEPDVGEDLPDSTEAARHAAVIHGHDFPSSDDDPTAIDDRDAA
ncbi:single-strand DNA-binding protein [Curtobacterium pusillum]|uniref:Single-strand DNA-binding protein n=1 Tax=Curtobacterium pusillum TaxID=69373 RepID=A0AAW3T848_9MICO|nr:single-stranded DNA-binding protein [Curtobacterium pusillum]MBA8991371.1 single-strand DNA-binding protein [Curtobacterium pusillum]